MQHLNLSGCFTTQKQVKRIVKKFKKSPSLLAIHLSTTVISGNPELMKYIEHKLDLKFAPKRTANHRAIEYKKGSNKELDNITWRSKFDHTQEVKN